MKTVHTIFFGIHLLFINKTNAPVSNALHFISTKINSTIFLRLFFMWSAFFYSVCDVLSLFTLNHIAFPQILFSPHGAECFLHRSQYKYVGYVCLRDHLVFLAIVFISFFSFHLSLELAQALRNKAHIMFACLFVVSIMGMLWHCITYFLVDFS